MGKKGKKMLSIVVPCYNEEEGLASLRKKIVPLITELENKYLIEVIFVNDGSRDKTFEVLQKMFGDLSWARIVSYSQNKGVGGAMRLGFLRAQGEYIAVIDSDCSYDLNCLLEMMEIIDSKEGEQGIDIVTVSPYHPHGTVEGVPAYRLLFSRAISLIYRQVTGLELYTYTAMVRVYRREVIEKIEFRAHDFLSFAELLILATFKGYKVMEMPATLRIRQFGQSNLRLMRVIWSHMKFVARIVGLKFTGKGKIGVQKNHGDLALSVEAEKIFFGHKKITILTVFGTRPVIVKLSPILGLLDDHFNHIMVHTGQHYDHNMDQVFFDDLKIRKPDYELHIGSGSHGEQTTKMMTELEKIITTCKIDIVLSCTDTNSSIASAITAAKLHCKVVHIEAGCRSFNKMMPEEINRIVADHCSDLLLAPDTTARENLRKEGIEGKKVVIVGSTAVEAARRNIEIAQEKSTILMDNNLLKGKYIVATLHRAENTNDTSILQGLLDCLGKVGKYFPVIFPMHPRTRGIITKEKLKVPKSIQIIEPVGYLDFLELISQAHSVMSDSGGIQEECAALDVPCLILRNETEWTYLTDIGKNVLIGTDRKEVSKFVETYFTNPHIREKMAAVEYPFSKQASLKIVEALNTFCEDMS